MSKRRVAAIAALSGFGLWCLVLALDGRQLDDYSGFVRSLPIAECTALAAENSDSGRASEVRLAWTHDGRDNAARMTQSGIWWGDHFQEHGNWYVVANSTEEFGYFGMAQDSSGGDVTLSTDSAVMQFRAFPNSPPLRFTVIVDSRCIRHMRDVSGRSNPWAQVSRFELKEPNAYPLSASR